MILPTGRLDVASPSLDLLFAGPGRGEGLVLVIGDRLVLGVDCCEPLARPDKTGATYVRQLLESLHEDVQVYWVLSHFHSDHYQGLRAVLNDIEPWLESIVVPGMSSSKDVAYEVAQNAFEARGRNADAHRARTAYVALRQDIEGHTLGSRSDSVAGSAASLVVLQAEDGKSHDLRIELHGLSHADAVRLRGKAMKRANKDGKRLSEKANDSSYVLKVAMGTRVILLLADCPSDISARYLRELPPWIQLLLKVSHHGSPTGTDHDLLRLIEQSKLDTGEDVHRVALLCPFLDKGLPDQRVLDTLSEYDYRLVRSDEVVREGTETFGWDDFGNFQLVGHTHSSVGRLTL